MNTKFVFVTGGVVSGLGKGITAASLGRLLKNRGYKVVNQKFDPYINVDPGTMSPYEHGEVFVTDDGAETDLDLGHYERFTNVNLTATSSITSGKIYSEVINRERKGDYLGKTVQVIPHITDAIKSKVYNFINSDVDVVITEIGGTIGDIESQAMVEAIRQIGFEVDMNDVCYIHVTLLPFISGSNELKSKPTQRSVRELQALGIRPDILVCRADQEIPEKMKEKIALFCNVRKEAVIENSTVKDLYEVPLMLENNGLAVQVCKKLNLDKVEPNNVEWIKLVDKIKNVNEGNNEVKIALIGKYVKLDDSYLSVIESLKHGGYANDVKVSTTLIDSELINDLNVADIISSYDGIIVPGGFGERGIEGMITSIKYARENKIPFLGICLGMQMAVIEFIRNVVGLEDVSSEEFKPDAKNPVIHIMENQKGIINTGGTMRLGAYPCELDVDSYAYKIYDKNDKISERHRHRYEFNNTYREVCIEKGLILSGKSPDGNLVEIVELSEKNHPFFIGVQFHPEFKSRPNRVAPLFKEFIKKSKR